MGFKTGDVVRYKSETLPMTVAWASMENNHPVVCCTFFDDSKTQKIIKTKPEALEHIPKSALRRLQKKQNQTGLKAFFENHPILIYGSVLFLGLGAGIGGLRAFIDWSGQELITKKSYVLIQDMKAVIDQGYVEKSKYDAITSENTELRLLVQRLGEKNNSNLLSQINNLRHQRDTIRASLQDIRARNSPLTFVLEQDRKPSSEEIDALAQIEDLNREINTLSAKVSN